MLLSLGIEREFIGLSMFVASINAAPHFNLKGTFIPFAYVCLYTDELNKKSLPDAYQEKGLSEDTAVLAIMHLN